MQRVLTAESLREQVIDASAKLRDCFIRYRAEDEYESEEDSVDLEKQAKREKLKKSAFVSGAQEALNSRFTDMFKAFQYVE